MRKFKIKTIEGQNDIGSMTEVVLRRLQRAKEEIESQTDAPRFLPLPEVIFVDRELDACACDLTSGRSIQLSDSCRRSRQRYKTPSAPLITDDGTETEISSVE